MAVSWMVLGGRDHDPCLPGLLHTGLHGERAVERYTAPSHPTTGLQSYTAYTALYSVVYYTAIQLIHYTALYNHPLTHRGPVFSWGIGVRLG